MPFLAQGTRSALQIHVVQAALPARRWAVLNGGQYDLRHREIQCWQRVPFTASSLLHGFCWCALEMMWIMWKIIQNTPCHCGGFAVLTAVEHVRWGFWLFGFRVCVCVLFFGGILFLFLDDNGSGRLCQGWYNKISVKGKLLSYLLMLMMSSSPDCVSGTPLWHSFQA